MWRLRLPPPPSSQPTPQRPCGPGAAGRCHTGCAPVTMYKRPHCRFLVSVSSPISPLQAAARVPETPIAHCCRKPCPCGTGASMSCKLALRRSRDEVVMVESGDEETEPRRQRPNRGNLGAGVGGGGVGSAAGEMLQGSEQGEEPGSSKPATPPLATLPPLSPSTSVLSCPEKERSEPQPSPLSTSPPLPPSTSMSGLKFRRRRWRHG